MKKDEIQAQIDQRQAQLKDADWVEESELKQEIRMLESLKHWPDERSEKELKYNELQRELREKQKTVSALGSCSQRFLAQENLNKEQRELFNRRFWGDLK